MTTLAPDYIRAQIELLRYSYPEVWEDESLLTDMLEAETDLHAFLGALVRKMLETGALAAGLETLIGELKERKERFDHRIETLRELALRVMQEWAGVKTIELPAVTLSVRAGTPRVVITNEDELPDDFIRIKREPFKHAIKLALQAGNSVPGATLSNAEPTLTVRTK